MKKLILTSAIAFSTLFASAQNFMVVSTYDGDQEETMDMLTQNLGFGYAINDTWTLGLIQNGEDVDGVTGYYNSMDKSPGSTPADARKITRPSNRTTQLNYPDHYCRNIYVTKTELGPERDGGLRTSMTYVMERAWPFAIDAVPLQFGSASITKVTAQFYYSKHRIVYHDPTDLSNKDLLPDFDDEEAPSWYRGKFQP